MRNMLQIVGGVAAAGVIATGATALTGSGVVFGGSNGGTATQFVGGTVTQSVTGATVTNVVYATDGTGTQTTSIAVTVTGASGKFLTLTPTGGTFSATGSGDSHTASEWKCTGNIATPTSHATAPKVELNNATATVTCATADAGTVQGFYRGLTNLSMAVTLV